MTYFMTTLKIGQFYEIDETTYEVIRVNLEKGKVMMAPSFGINRLLSIIRIVRPDLEDGIIKKIQCLAETNIYSYSDWVYICISKALKGNPMPWENDCVELDPWPGQHKILSAASVI